MKLFKFGLLRCLVFAAVLGLAGHAHATVVNFDDLGDGVVPDGYGGIIWGGNWDSYTEPQYPYNPSSPPGRIYADYNLGCCTYAATGFSFAAPVVFNGADFAGVDYTPTSFNLYLDGNLVWSSASLDISATPTFLPSGYGGLVDEVDVLGSRDYYVMDDVTYNGTAEVPVPGALALLGFGLFGLGGLRRKKIIA